MQPVDRKTPDHVALDVIPADVAAPQPAAAPAAATTASPAAAPTNESFCCKCWGWTFKDCSQYPVCTLAGAAALAGIALYVFGRSDPLAYAGGGICFALSAALFYSCCHIRRLRADNDRLIGVATQVNILGRDVQGAGVEDQILANGTEQLRAENTRLQKQVLATETANAERKKEEDQRIAKIQELEGKLDTTEKKLSTAEENGKKLSVEIEQLKALRAGVTADTQALANAGQTVKAETKENESSLALLGKANAELNVNLEQQKALIVTLQQEIKELREQYEDLQKEKDELLANQTALVDENSKAKQMVEELEAMKERLEKAKTKLAQVTVYLEQIVELNPNLTKPSHAASATLTHSDTVEFHSPVIDSPLSSPSSTATLVTIHTSSSTSPVHLISANPATAT